MSHPNNGIPSLTEICNDGRRVQDRKQLEFQMNAEKAKRANLTRTPLTLDMVRAEASETQLSNDRVMRLGEEKLELRVKIAEITVNTFWTRGLVIPQGLSNQKTAQFIMRAAWKSFPKMHQMIYRAKDATPDRTKKKVSDSIAHYLRTCKYVAQSIILFAYGKSGNENATPRRERYLETGDILNILKLVRIVDETFDGNEDAVEPAAMTALFSFRQIDPHYTYTLDDGGRDELLNDNSVFDADLEDDSDDILLEREPETVNNEPRFVAIA